MIGLFYSCNRARQPDVKPCHAVHDPPSILRRLVAIVVVSLVYVLYYLRSERSWDFVFGILYAHFSFFALT